VGFFVFTGICDRPLTMRAWQTKMDWNRTRVRTIELSAVGRQRPPRLGRATADPPGLCRAAMWRTCGMRRDEKIASMLERARELARRGHYPAMIEAVLGANGFPEAAEWIEQSQIRRELKAIADQARRGQESTGAEPGDWSRNATGNQGRRCLQPVRNAPRRAAGELAVTVECLGLGPAVLIRR
jgi:hypothetical protein